MHLLPFIRYCFLLMHGRGSVLLILLLADAHLLEGGERSQDGASNIQTAALGCLTSFTADYNYKRLSTTVTYCHHIICSLR